ncbi:magnesium transporter [Crepidotus variabilis]|uniref:Magnesium transporter n=1 Tax=Crepidotus variabilis TaxID=179855 RepID=A0A9P6ET08_9AGAR|nr:magnesium transporter [Crepidotus variabilis]
MPRTNSLSDSEGRSITPEPGDEDYPISALAASSPVNGRPRASMDHHAHGITSALERIKTHSRHTLQRPPVSAFSGLTPKDKFRAAVRKVVSLRRGLTFPGIIGRVGAEPGVDPRRPQADAAYGHLRAKCDIEIIDYSAIRRVSKKLNNLEFMQFMDADSPDPVRRDPWVKVRWINIGGISWDVIKALGIKYNLHPLALEDVVKGNPRTRSKADYYTRHLFMRVLCHQLGEAELRNAHNVYKTERSSSPEPIEVLDDEMDKGDEDRTKFNSPDSTFKEPSSGILPTHRKEVTINSVQSDGPNSLSKLLRKEKEAKLQREDRKKEEATLQAIKEGERVAVDVSTMYLFLFRDGTVISIHPTPDLTFTSPIADRLQPMDTVLRKSADPSLLIHALLDLIIDRTLAVVDRFHSNITKYEHDILLRPKMKTVKLLHILSGDLILHKRTLEPIKTMIYGLRRYDIDRCAALIDSSDPNNKDVQVVGFMSHKAKIYLADVYDHTDYILTSMDMFASIAENLIAYTFNMASYEMNEVMRRLTLATIIFLPLTVLTGYFGMNFDRFWSVHNNSDLFFWELAIPLVVLTIMVALFPDGKKLWHYMTTRREAKKIIRDKYGKQD